VVRTLFDNRCSMAPILSCDPGGLEVPNVLHIATLGGVLSCLMRHFRASLASLPLLAQPLCALALGTWSEEAAAEADHLHYRHQQLMMSAAGAAAGGAAGDGASALERAGSAAAAAAANGRSSSGAVSISGKDGGTLHVRALQTVHPSTPLTVALGMLLDAGVSALPVVDERGVLLDVYARADITHLCRGNAYNRLQWEDVTVRACRAPRRLGLALPRLCRRAQLGRGACLMGSGLDGRWGPEPAQHGGRPCTLHCAFFMSWLCFSGVSDLIFPSSRSPPLNPPPPHCHPQVGQALSLSQPGPTSWSQGGGPPGAGLLSGVDTAHGEAGRRPHAHAVKPRAPCV
jgi:CBS domain-containing protein